MSKFAEKHDFNDIKDLRISTLYKKEHSWFSDKSKFDFLLRFQNKGNDFLKMFEDYHILPLSSLYR